MEIREGNSSGNMIAWEQVGTILQGFGGLNTPKAILSGDFTDNDIVVCTVNEMKFPIWDEGGVTGFVSSAQRDEGECDAWSVRVSQRVTGVNLLLLGILI